MLYFSGEGSFSHFLLVWGFSFMFSSVNTDYVGSIFCRSFGGSSGGSFLSKGSSEYFCNCGSEGSVEFKAVVLFLLHQIFQFLKEGGKK